MKSFLSSIILSLLLSNFSYAGDIFAGKVILDVSHPAYVVAKCDSGSTLVLMLQSMRDVVAGKPVELQEESYVKVYDGYIKDALRHSKTNEFGNIRYGSDLARKEFFDHHQESFMKRMKNSYIEVVIKKGP
jgi:hypothetical protein